MKSFIQHGLSWSEYGVDYVRIFDNGYTVLGGSAVSANESLGMNRSLHEK